MLLSPFLLLCCFLSSNVISKHHWERRKNAKERDTHAGKSILKTLDISSKKVKRKGSWCFLFISLSLTFLYVSINAKMQRKDRKTPTHTHTNTPTPHTHTHKGKAKEHDNESKKKKEKKKSQELPYCFLSPSLLVPLFRTLFINVISKRHWAIRRNGLICVCSSFTF